MCGIAGFLSADPEWNTETCIAVGRQMAASLAHRGPDDQGVWTDAARGIVLAHRRLAILDLSHEGHQPMVSACGRYRLTYNGEIYNYVELRDQLAAMGYPFRGQSDTEVLLAAVATWGLRESVQKCNGMFAFALWDAHEQALTLVRDRLGIKPLYYGWSGKTLLFASELKAIRAHPTFRGTIDRDALALFLQHNYVPSPYSIYRDVKKLCPGTHAQFRVNNVGHSDVSVYWDARERFAEAATATRIDWPEAVGQLEDHLREATRLRMQADVPWGAFLSGGIDSSLIVASMQKQVACPIRTFTIGFEDAAFDESPYARRVAQHLGTDHHEYRVTAAEARDLIPRLPQIYDEPFSDSSQIPTFLVSQVARQEVTVCLSGDGGDELFGGYDRYFTVERLRQKLERIWPAARRGMAAVLQSAPFGRARVWSRMLRGSSPQELYPLVVRHWDRTEDLVLGSSPVASPISDAQNWSVPGDLISKLMWIDTISYLPDDILTKVDRASMAVGLEVRVPLLDHRLVEFTWSLPLEYKVRGPVGKQLLRELLSRQIPRDLFERRKVGFGVPLADWLRGPLRDWAESLLSVERLGRDGFLAPQPVRRCWQKHLKGRCDWHYWLWDILMFQAWLESEQCP